MQENALFNLLWTCGLLLFARMRPVCDYRWAPGASKMVGLDHGIG
jgi:hypothetical protein